LLTVADAFLPFQIEDASSSAFVLYLIRAIAPSLISNDSWCDNLECVLDKLIAKGNLAAPLRRLELRQLEQILAPLTPRLTNYSLPAASLGDGSDNNEETYTFDQDEFEWDMLALNSSVSLPPRELLDLADQLDVDGIMQTVGV
jgi:proline utilization trans-activator